MKKALLGFLASIALLLLPAVAGATVTVNFTGNVFNPGDPDCPPPGVGCENQNVDFKADFTISGDNLSIVLTNQSANTTDGPYALLTSFYFKIAGAPTLTYTGATGDVCKADKNATDNCTNPVPDKSADLRAFNTNDNTWQFRQGLTLAAGSTTLTYGVGTAGNNSLGTNGFMGTIVDGRDYGIYTGDITKNNLDGDLLVHNSVTFTFSGLTGITESAISNVALFGLGTQPDSTGLVPEPSTALLLVTGLAGLAWVGRRRLG